MSAYHGRPEPQQWWYCCEDTFTERHIWYYCLLAANQGNYVYVLYLIKNLENFSLYRRKNYHNQLRCLLVANFLNVYSDFIGVPVFNTRNCESFYVHFCRPIGKVLSIDTLTVNWIKITENLYQCCRTVWNRSLHHVGRVATTATKSLTCLRPSGDLGTAHGLHTSISS
jgi:hypothetical protein